MSDIYDQRALDIIDSYSGCMDLAHPGELAELIAQALREAAGEERERCAKVAERPIALMEEEHRQWREFFGDGCAQPHEDEIFVRREIASDIRAHPPSKEEG